MTRHCVVRGAGWVEDVPFLSSRRQNDVSREERRVVPGRRRSASGAVLGVRAVELWNPKEDRRMVEVERVGTPVSS